MKHYSTGKETRFRCRHPDCTKSRKTWWCPEEVRVHRFHTHGEPWEGGKRSKVYLQGSRTRKGNSQLAEPEGWIELPSQVRITDLFKNVSTPMLMAEVESRIQDKN